MLMVLIFDGCSEHFADVLTKRGILIDIFDIDRSAIFKKKKSEEACFPHRRATCSELSSTMITMRQLEMIQFFKKSEKEFQRNLD